MARTKRIFNIIGWFLDVLVGPVKNSVVLIVISLVVLGKVDVGGSGINHASLGSSYVILTTNIYAALDVGMIDGGGNSLELLLLCAALLLLRLLCRSGCGSLARLLSLLLLLLKKCLLCGTNGIRSALGLLSYGIVDLFVKIVYDSKVCILHTQLLQLGGLEDGVV